MTSYPHVKVKIIADSHAEHIGCPRLTTFELTYPRFTHAEFMTHRVISRNAQSSRAIPTKKRVERVNDCPVTPIKWGANQKGMVAKDEEVEDIAECEYAWDSAAKMSAGYAQELMELGLHKQWASRLLEPFDTITVIATATKWGNFFALRCAPDAQPEIHHLAWRMADLYYTPTPDTKVLDAGQAHVPYVSDYEVSVLGVETAIKCSVARCARVSYLNHDGSEPDIDKDIALYERLYESGHMSPMEHQAIAATSNHWKHGNLSPNWLQHRKTLDNEVRQFDYKEALKGRMS